MSLFFQKKHPPWAVFFGIFTGEILRITAVYRSFRVAKVDARWGAGLYLLSCAIHDLDEGTSYYYSSK